MLNGERYGKGYLVIRLLNEKNIGRMTMMLISSLLVR